MRALTLAIAIVPALTTLSQAEGDAPAGEAEGDDDVENYVNQGTIEVGGDISGRYRSDDWTFTLSPTFGYFVVDRFELTVELDLTYTNLKDNATGVRDSTTRGALILEPSYHHPISDRMLVQAGLGLGVGYDGDEYDFEIIPDLGLNIMVGHSSLITPEIKVPIKFGKRFSNTGNVGNEIGVELAVGITTTW